MLRLDSANLQLLNKTYYTLFQIHRDKLAFGTKDYLRELYRMNLSCSGGGLPESGCLFFKVGRKTNTTKGEKLLNA